MLVTQYTKDKRAKKFREKKIIIANLLLIIVVIATFKTL